ncbi:membrane protein [Streptomyces lividans]|uniref:Integral membrane protein n=1 Tax=Streptomyces lividans TK24 TaxID=457428 RepID=A0ABM5R3U8_STRLI|nr:integral membrane protein [Streptomyces lividans TK24]EFD68264.1 integral membrane protein [Streptomyces lividans TK24]QSJ10409.1 integral membrane protein [Streptomyces lividans]QTD71319.1 integral membrane protein [Streptomyces lividans TK24] [Streptomyces lividans]BDE40404.1 membrane protein [Streptomyces lividans]
MRGLVRRLLAKLARLGARVDERTPAHRDRAVDGLRALALLAVPTGHWLVGGFILDGGGLHNASPLATFGALAPASWVLQMLGIFFLVGGYSSVLSYRRRKGSVREWTAGRLRRLGRPVLGVTAVWALLLPVLHYGLGVPGDTLHTAATLVVQPLWFVGVYAVITALTPYCVRASERLGARAAVPLIGAVAVVDLLRYGPFADAMPSWLSLLNLLPGWMFAYQLGVSWADRRIGRRGAWLLLAGGTALFAVLLLAFHYPMSMVGVPGEARTNSHPPSLLVLALAAAQSGAAILLRDRLARLLRRPALWAPVVIVNLSAMTILCWHQTAMLAAAVPGSYFGEIPGLTAAPDTGGWVLARLAWMPLFAGLLAAVARFARPLESPWDRTGTARRAAAAVLAAGFGYFALAA